MNATEINLQAITIASSGEFREAIKTENPKYSADTDAFDVRVNCFGPPSPSIGLNSFNGNSDFNCSLAAPEWFSEMTWFRHQPPVPPPFKEVHLLLYFF